MKWTRKKKLVNYTTVVKTILRIRNLFKVFEIKVLHTPEFLKSVLNKFNLVWVIKLFNKPVYLITLFKKKFRKQRSMKVSNSKLNI